MMVHQRAPLHAGKERFVEILRVLPAAQDQPRARAAEGLVRGRGDEVCVRDRTWVDAAGDEAGDVRHVDNHRRADRPCHSGDAGKVDLARVRAGAHHDHPRFVLEGEPLQLLVVDPFVVLAHAVRDDGIELAGEIERMSVRQVAAVSQVHAEHGVAGFQQGEVDGHVRLRPGMRLHVGVIGAEELLGA